jgi:hypothetical protein
MNHLYFQTNAGGGNFMAGIRTVKPGAKQQILEA